MGTVTLPITNPAADADNTNYWSDVYSDLTAITDQVNGSLNDANLASPPHGLYKTIFEAKGVTGIDQAAATLLLDSVGSDARMFASAGSVTVNTASYEAPRIFYFDDADYTVANKTLKLRLRAQVAANATAPAINFTFGLYPVTVAGGADVLTYTAGSVVANSTVALTTPSASTVTQGNSGDFAFPADGAYILAVVTSGTIANNSAVSCHAQLQYRNT